MNTPYRRRLTAGQPTTASPQPLPVNYQRPSPFQPMLQLLLRELRGNFGHKLVQALAGEDSLEAVEGELNAVI